MLFVQYNIGIQQLLAAMKDRVSVNELSVQTLKIVYPSLLSVGCFSHTIDHVGEHFLTPNLSEFITSWISLFSHSQIQRFCGMIKQGSQWLPTVLLAGGAGGKSLNRFLSNLVMFSY